MSDPSRVDTAGHAVYRDGLTRGRGVGRPRTEFSRSEEVFGVSGACFVCRRSLWERLGGMDAAFESYGEDGDFCWRARLLGARCWYVPDATVHHQFSASY